MRLILIFLVANFYSFSQSNIQGQVQYIQILSFEGTTSQRFDTQLDFTTQFSLYQNINQTKVPKQNSLDSSTILFDLDMKTKIRVWKNWQQGQMVSLEYVLTKKFDVVDSIPHLSWKVGENTRQIGPFNCLNAYTTFRGRTYEAWFCPDIPSQHGPWKLGGLPGLILEAKDSTEEVQFLLKSISYPVQNPDLLVAPSIENKIDFESYKSFWRKKVKDFTNQLNSSNRSVDSNFEVNAQVTKIKMIEDLFH